MDSETLCEVRDVFLNDRECQYDHFELLFMSSSARLTWSGSGWSWEREHTLVTNRNVANMVFPSGVSWGLRWQVKPQRSKRGLVLHISVSYGRQ